ncbi:MAG: hypothetical protein QOI55_1139, partial [Actinomycetota bacterium]|nr:hypothetical protein [Actinomycetota bacterium]
MAGVWDIAVKSWVPGDAEIVRDRPARVVAVTTARAGTAKRGLATGIARLLARLDHTRVCIVDADITRDVGTRFEVARPTTVDVDRAFGVVSARDALSVI